MRIKVVPGFRPAIAALALLGIATAANANTVLWYSGDPVNPQENFTEAYSNSSSFPITHFQSFPITDPLGWDINDVFSVGDVFSDSGSAEWSIREGMSDGNGGIVLASGVSPETLIPYLGRTKIEVAGLNIHLSPGTYWLQVSPYLGQISLTNGQNAIGAQTGASGIQNWPSSNENYLDLGTQSPTPIVFSMGVETASSVPEPGSVASLLGLALSGAAFLRRRKA